MILCSFCNIRIAALPKPFNDCNKRISRDEIDIVLDYYANLENYLSIRLKNVLLFLQLDSTFKNRPSLDLSGNSLTITILSHNQQLLLNYYYI